MAYFKREGGGDRGGFGGPKKFGSDRGGFRKPFGADRGFSDAPREMFDATCAECGEATQVPFRPNGRKPVYCRNCFKKEEGGAPRRDDRGFEPRPRFDAPRFDAPRPDTRTLASKDGMQLSELSTKLDRIIRLLEEAKHSGQKESSPAIALEVKSEKKAEEAAPAAKAVKAEKKAKVAKKAKK